MRDSVAAAGTAVVAGGTAAAAAPPRRKLYKISDGSVRDCQANTVAIASDLPALLLPGQLLLLLLHGLPAMVINDGEIPLLPNVDRAAALAERAGEGVLLHSRYGLALLRPFKQTCA